MSDHLTPQEIEDYRSRRLDPNALLAADDHLATCPECRALAAPDPAALRGLKQAFPTIHLDDAQLEAYAEGRLRDSDPAREHLSACVRCREEADDLRAFALERAAARARRPWRLWAPIAAFAAAACALGFIVLLPPKPVMRQAMQQAATPSLPAELAQIKREALASGSVAPPPEIAALAGHRGTLLGTGVEEALALTSPIGTAVLALRPEFQWKAIEGAQWYEVSVFDTNFEPVAASGRIHDPQWTPDHDLAAGKEFLWQLEVAVNGRRITAPKPPEPEAKFATLPAAESARLADLAARYGSDHILMGALYARAGALQDARREWQAAVAQGHPEAAALLK
jgi:hypothetical protein